MSKVQLFVQKLNLTNFWLSLTQFDSISFSFFQFWWYVFLGQNNDFLHSVKYGYPGGACLFPFYGVHTKYQGTLLHVVNHFLARPSYFSLPSYKAKGRRKTNFLATTIPLALQLRLFWVNLIYYINLQGFFCFEVENHYVLLHTD